MRYFLFTWIIVAGMMMASCTAMGSGTSADTVTGIRTPQPTFTPTPFAALQVDAPPPASTPEAEPAAEEPLPSDNAPASNGPRVVVNTPLVNLRTGPGTTYDVVVMAERGEEFEVVGRNGEGTWWFICCAEGDYAWIHNDLVDTDGPVDSVPITGGATEATDAAVTPAAPAPAAASSAQFDLIRQEQFAETSLVRVYLYVTADSAGLSGYRARIIKDGRELPVDETSFGGQPAFTWPFQDARQRHQNFKVEFSNESPAGVWEVQLLNADGMVVGPAARFTLTANDPMRELYVRYERR